METVLIKNTVIILLTLVVSLGASLTYYGATTRDGAALRMVNEKLATIFYYGAFDHIERHGDK